MIATYIAGVAFFCACAERSVWEGVGGPELVAEGGAAGGLVPQRHRDLLQHDAVLALCTRLMLALPSVHQFFHERIRLLSKHVGRLLTRKLMNIETIHSQCIQTGVKVKIYKYKFAHL